MYRNACIVVGGNAHNWGFPFWYDQWIEIILDIFAEEGIVASQGTKFMDTAQFNGWHMTG